MEKFLFSNHAVSTKHATNIGVTPFAIFTRAYSFHTLPLRMTVPFPTLFRFFFKILEITTLYPQQVMPSNVKITGNSCQLEQKLLSPDNSGSVSTPLHWTHRKSVRLKIERSWWLSTDNSGFVNLTSKTISAEACDVGDTFFTDKLSVAWVAVIKHFSSSPTSEEYKLERLSQESIFSIICRKGQEPRVHYWSWWSALVGDSLTRKN